MANCKSFSAKIFESYIQLMVHLKSIDRDCREVVSTMQQDSLEHLPEWATHKSCGDSDQFSSVIMIQSPELMLIDEQLEASDPGAEVTSIPMIQEQVSGEIGELTSSQYMEPRPDSPIKQTQSKGPGNIRGDLQQSNSDAGIKSGVHGLSQDQLETIKRAQTKLVSSTIE